MSSAQAVSDSTFESEVLKSSGPVLVDFYADWCGPCKAMAPLLDQVSADLAGKLKIVKINIDESPNAPTKYGVRGIPTFIIFKDGQAVDTRVGGMSKAQLSDWLSSAV